MPSEHRTGFFANHPLVVATTAASGGVLLGAYVAVQLFASPVQQGPAASDAQPVAQASAKPPPEPKAPVIAAPETTGAAPPKNDVAAVDRCEGQTWPNLSRDCTDQMQNDRRAARATAPGQLDKRPPEAPAIASVDSNAAAPAAGAPNTAMASAPAVSPPAVQPSDSQASDSQVSTPAPPAAVPASAPSNPQDQDVASVGAAADSSASKAAEKRKIKEAKRRAKRLRMDESDDALALAAGDDRDRVEGRAERYRRERVIVDRGNDDDATLSREGRRVIVIRREGRGGPGGIFENMFGN